MSPLSIKGILFQDKVNLKIRIIIFSFSLPILNRLVNKQQTQPYSGREVQGQPQSLLLPNMPTFGNNTSFHGINTPLKTIHVHNWLLFPSVILAHTHLHHVYLTCPPPFNVHGNIYQARSSSKSSRSGSTGMHTRPLTHKAETPRQTSASEGS